MRKLTVIPSPREYFVRFSDEILSINETLKTSTPQGEMEALHSRRDELYRLKRHLISDEPSKWQSTQLHAAKGSGASVADQVSYFNHIRRLDPPRDQLPTLSSYRPPP